MTGNEKLAMKKLNKIVVSTDLSTHSFYAIKKAQQIAKLHQAELIVIHVLEKNFFDKLKMNVLPPTRKKLIQSKEYVASILEKKMKKLKNKSIKSKLLILTGQKPAQKIIQYTKKEEPDLLIIGSHGDYSFRDWFVGTTAEFIAGKTTCPVLIVKNRTLKRYKKILLPIDFSQASKTALQFSNTFLPKTSRFDILHVGDHAYKSLIQDEYSHKPDKKKKLSNEIVQLLLKKAKEFIEENAKKMRASFKIKLGYPGLVILEEAKKLRPDLILMGTKGHSQRHYMWLGSVANRVLTEVTQDILLVPPKKNKSKVKFNKNKFLEKITESTNEYLSTFKQVVKHKQDEK